MKKEKIDEFKRKYKCIIDLQTGQLKNTTDKQEIKQISNKINYYKNKLGELEDYNYER